MVGKPNLSCLLDQCGDCCVLIVVHWHCLKLVSSWSVGISRSLTRSMSLVIPFVQYFGASPLQRRNSWVINVCAQDHSSELAAKCTVKQTPMMKHSSRESSNWKFGNDSCNLFIYLFFFLPLRSHWHFNWVSRRTGGSFDTVNVTPAIWSLSELQSRLQVS